MKTGYVWPSELFLDIRTAYLWAFLQFPKKTLFHHLNKNRSKGHIIDIEPPISF